MAGQSGHESNADEGVLYTSQVPCYVLQFSIIPRTHLLVVVYPFAEDTMYFLSPANRVRSMIEYLFWFLFSIKKS